MKNINQNRRKSPSKTYLAKELGVSRSSLYYKPIMPKQDLELKNRIIDVMKEHPSYGCRRMAIHLGINHKRAHRVMQLFGFKARRLPNTKLRPKAIYDKANNKNNNTYPNILGKEIIDKPNQAWVSDFTYLPFNNKFIYLATILDNYTREIIAWNISYKHNANFTISALQIALKKEAKNQIYFIQIKAVNIEVMI